MLSFNLISCFFYLFDDFRHPLLKLADRHGIAWMERQRDHTLHAGKIDLDEPVIIRSGLRCHLSVSIAPAVL